MATIIAMIMGTKFWQHLAPDGCTSRGKKGVGQQTTKIYIYPLYTLYSRSNKDARRCMHYCRL